MYNVRTLLRDEHIHEFKAELSKPGWYVKRIKEIRIQICSKLYHTHTRFERVAV